MFIAFFLQFNPFKSYCIVNGNIILTRNGSHDSARHLDIQETNQEIGFRTSPLDNNILLMNVLGSLSITLHLEMLLMLLQDWIHPYCHSYSVTVALIVFR